ncbi:hypothetical protein SPS_48 [Sphingomonas phage Scott]|uniref:Uncharacterized protein n=1 Tax=Sphingomonas phage Scott TaxID=2282912 RepID=A0A346FDE5_9CAUD|nr:hypothetical protein HOT83_gp48 [Sphingomonas phage Scott]AXN53759.1 hypothetical protein SPS_48 [Sphingomonas phage Scott]
MSHQVSSKAKAAAERIVKEFRPNGWPAKEQEIARFLDLTFGGTDAKDNAG